ncbi:MAG: HEAT repeat domain-containing protein [Planctomycetota bacterium]|nr:HEAT repeat domain-containing protein [Planctomycetota bacterium]
MKIHFCDLCNESVPQSALDSGSARLIKGRVICATCEAAMSHAPAPAGGPAPHALHAQPSQGGAALGSARVVPEAPIRIAPAPEPAVHAPAAAPQVASAPPATPPVPAPARSNAGLAWVAGLAIGFTALSIFVTDDRLARMARSQSALETELAKKDDALRGLASEFSKVHPALAGVESRITERLDAAQAREAASTEALGALRADLGRFTGRIDALAAELERVRARVDQPGLGTEIEKRFDELSSRIAKAEDERRALAEKLAAATTAAPSAAPQPGAAAAPAAPPAWTKYLVDLKSSEETVRWDAVTTLGATNDPAVVPHLLPMLKDATWLVRMAAARVLGEMKVREAVPQLIAMLEDVDSAARETAWIALRVITGKDLKFDSFAPEAERAKRAKAWSDWWKKEGGEEAAKVPAGP